jgi:hypothetical protein
LTEPDMRESLKGQLASVRDQAVSQSASPTPTATPTPAEK